MTLCLASQAGDDVGRVLDAGVGAADDSHGWDVAEHQIVATAGAEQIGRVRVCSHAGRVLAGHAANGGGAGAERLVPGADAG